MKHDPSVESQLASRSHPWALCGANLDTYPADVRGIETRVPHRAVRFECWNETPERPLRCWFRVQMSGLPHGRKHHFCIECCSRWRDIFDTPAPPFFLEAGLSTSMLARQMAGVGVKPDSIESKQEDALSAVAGNLAGFQEDS